MNSEPQDNDNAEIIESGEVTRDQHILGHLRDALLLSEKLMAAAYMVETSDSANKALTLFKASELDELVPPSFFQGGDEYFLEKVKPQFREFAETWRKEQGILTEIISRYENIVNSETQVDYDSRDIKQEIEGRLQEIFDHTVSAELNNFQIALNRIFPEKIATVDCPKDIDVDIPKVQTWQRSVGIKDPDIADLEYIALTQSTRLHILRDLENIDRPQLELDQTEEVPADSQLFLLEEGIVDIFNKYLAARDDTELDYSITERPIEQISQLKNLLKLLKSYPRQSQDQKKARFIRDTVSANTEPVRQLAKDTVHEMTNAILEEWLTLLAEKLKMYVLTDEVAASSVERVVKRKRERKAASSERIPKNQPEIQEVDLPEGEIIVDRQTFPWIESEDDIWKALYVKNGQNGGIVVFDARTSAAKEIEHRMSGYETVEKRQEILPIIADKLTMVADGLVYSRPGELSLSALVRPNEVDYPYPIFYWRNLTPNAKRIYISIVKTDNLPEGEVRDELRSANIDELVLFLGACNKQNQRDLLKILSEDSDKQLRAALL